jgi:nucleotide-binding universal stress UspA family protein
VLSGDQGGPVVVAVGADSNGQAVEWAAAEAAARGSELRVVHAERLRRAVDPSGLVPVVVDVSSHRLAAEDILRVAVRRARAVAPDVEISEESMFGSTVPLLVSQGRRAQLLVLGSRNAQVATGMRRLRAPSVCGGVARRAPCPVAIVRPLRSSPPPGAPPRVVVGVDGSAACAAALGVAFGAAAQRGLPVTAVHAWSPDVPADHEAACGPYQVAEERAGRTVKRALEPWQSQCPDVPVETQLTHADPASALIRASEGAALVVVGSRAHGVARAALWGSVSRTVAQRARCPVVVVRTAKARTAKTWRDQPAEAGRAATVPHIDPAGTDAVQRRRSPWE